MTEKLNKLMNDSPGMRWGMLVLISMTMLAAYFFVDMIAPLMTMIQANYKWSPGAYGFFSGSEYMLNVCGFLILSGIILDKMGIRFSGFAAALVMVVGGLIKLYGLTPEFNNGGFGFDFFNSFLPDLPPSAKVASIGYTLFGVGVEMAGITTSRTVVKWFKGKELALAMGMQMSIARLGASAALALSPIISGAGTANENPLNSAYVGLALLAIGLMTFTIYTFFDRKFDKQIEDTNPSDPADEFHVRDLAKIIKNPGFICIALLCVTFYCGVFPFLKYATSMFESKLSIDTAAASKISAFLPIGTIILTPVFGYFLDKKGKGASLMLLGGLLMGLSHLVFAVMPITTFWAYVVMGVLGVSFSLVPASMWPSVPKIVEERYLGSAYALVFWIQNIGLWAMPAIIGIVLDAANPGVAGQIQAGVAGAKYDYTIPMLCFTALGVLAIIFAFALVAIDKKKGYGLEKPNKV